MNFRHFNQNIRQKRAKLHQNNIEILVVIGGSCNLMSLQECRLHKKFQEQQIKNRKIKLLIQDYKK